MTIRAVRSEFIFFFQAEDGIRDKLVTGVQTCALPIYQRNYELFIEAGFAPAQAIQIMTANGAKILGVTQTLGTVETGKLADLVVLHGDLTADPSVIRRPTIVFKDGVGYDSAKLMPSVQGRVGVN